MKYKGVIFDFNGVLLWDALLHELSWQTIALKLRGSEMTEQEFALHMHGRPNRYVHPATIYRIREHQTPDFKLASRPPSTKSLWRFSVPLRRTGLNGTLSKILKTEPFGEEK